MTSDNSVTTGKWYLAYWLCVGTNKDFRHGFEKMGLTVVHCEVTVTGLDNACLLIGSCNEDTFKEYIKNNLHDTVGGAILINLHTQVICTIDYWPCNGTDEEPEWVSFDVGKVVTGNK